MRAVTVQCPNCGARLDAAQHAETATCAYCGTTARIQQRTRFLERPKPLPSQPAQVKYPVARQGHSRAWVFLVIAFTVVPVLGGVLLTMKKAGVVGKGNMLWGSDWTLAADVNGDGVTDAIGRARYIGGGEQTVSLAAYDGESGDQIWEAESLGDFMNTVQATLALAGDTLVYVDELGRAIGYSLKSGEKKWEGALGERLESICRAEAEGSVLLQTADERWQRLSLADGSREMAEAPAACEPLPTDTAPPRGDAQVLYDRYDRSGPSSDAFEGIRLEGRAKLEDGVYLAFGHKDPGTGIPIVFRYREIRDDELRYEVEWKLQVPSVDPLTVKEGAPEHYAVIGDVVVIVYPMNEGGPRAAAFSLESGERRWDLGLPEAFITSIGGVTGAGDRAFVRVSDRLDAIRISSGEKIWTIGRED